MNKEKVLVIFEQVLGELEELYESYGDYISGEAEGVDRERMDAYRKEFLEALNLK